MILMSFLSHINAFTRLVSVRQDWKVTFQVGEGLSLPHYSLIRKDAARSQYTDLAVYINSSISKIVRRRPDLESEAVESVWLEIQTRKSSILVAYIYRNPASTFDLNKILFKTK